MLCTEGTRAAATMPPPRNDKEALERAIARDEEALKEALGNIEQAVRSRVSVAERIRREPYKALASAFFCGVGLGMTFFAPQRQLF